MSKDSITRRRFVAGTLVTGAAAAVPAAAEAKRKRKPKPKRPSTGSVRTADVVIVGRDSPASLQRATSAPPATR